MRKPSLAETSHMKRPHISRLLALVLVLAGIFGSAFPVLAASGIHASYLPHHRIARYPSGLAMPTAPVSSWRKVFADDFTGSKLDPGRWRTYAGQPGSDTGGWFDRTHVSVSNGELVISEYRDPADGGKWATGGVSSSRGLIQTYGKYLVRFRFDAGAGISHAILLWPADESWPPEVDFSEDNGEDRQTTYATLHHGALNTMIHNQVEVDLTKWHTVGVTWTRGKLVYTLDGRRWATVRSKHVPSIPMVLDIQTQAWATGINNWERGVDATTPANVNLYVDWVVAYAPRKAARR